VREFSLQYRPRIEVLFTNAGEKISIAQPPKSLGFSDGIFEGLYWTIILSKGLGSQLHDSLCNQ
jgi:hypothetical protein